MVAWTAPIAKSTGDDFDLPAYQAIADDLNFFKGDAAWTPVTYAAGWSAYGGGLQFRKIGDFIYLMVYGTQGGGAGTTIGTLPVGARPSIAHQHPLNANGTPSFFGVATTGVITVVLGGAGAVVAGEAMVPLL